MTAVWGQYLAFVAQMWGTVWVPFGAALLAALAVMPESRGGAWRGLRVRPVPPAGLYLAKVAVLIAEGALASLLMAALVLLFGSLLIGGLQPVHWEMLAITTFVPFVGALPLLSLHLWLAAAKGIAPSFTVMVGGFLTEMVLMTNPLGLLSPWTYPMRATMLALGGNNEPIAGLGAALPVLGLSLGVALALAVLGAAWFARSEVK